MVGNGGNMSTPSDPQGLPPLQPGLPHRLASSLIMGTVSSISRAFLYGLNSVEVTGLQRFLDILDQRRDPLKRQRGLITVSNHISIVDDPLIWGVLPLHYAFDPANHRWGLGAHDICFQNKILGSFFSYGQVLPTHRHRHSPHGGLFQPTMTQAIRLLCAPPSAAAPPPPPQGGPQDGDGDHDPPPDPFTAGGLTYYTTDGADAVPAPSAHLRNRHGWVHVFPEACVHQHPALFLRYFKWGVSRLILEAEPAPDVLPVFVDGFQRVMPEGRGWPRFLPRARVDVRLAFGEALDADVAFGDLRRRWRDLVRRDRERQLREQEKQPQHPQEGGGNKKSHHPLAVGELTDELKYGAEATELRVEVARRVRDEVLKVRRGMGFADDGPAGFELAETWAAEPPKDAFKSNVDDSLVNKRE
ncbi:hypothetical protein GGR56DRAFT_302526 [Xylariaceae sp. FL0804]|nr:hypothetical protein GGR56DRAFT_302526 [Xylariaceae sp. FL0804]